MSQAAPAPQAPQPAPGPMPAPAPGQAPIGQAPMGQARGAHRDAAQKEQARIEENVPQVLNRLQYLVVGVLVTVGLLAAFLQFSAAQASGRAGENTEQVVRVQKVQALLLRADAIATNGYLVGGLEDADQRAQYDEAIDEVVRLITDAADAQPADRTALAELNATVTSYTTAVAQARDYNRQQLEIGIAYLTDAGNTLRREALPITQALVDANSDRAVDEMDAPSPLLLLLLGLVTLVVLVWVNREVARRFHRRVNVGLAVAAVIAVGGSFLAAGAAALQEGSNSATRDGAYREAIAEASARTAANNAASFESQGLINRGSGATYDELWNEQAQVVTDNASRDVQALWDVYVARYQAVRFADDGGDWDAARDLSIANGPGTARYALDAVDGAAAQAAEAEGARAAEQFQSGNGLTMALALLALVGGFAAALAAARGINQRRKEYL